MDGQTNQENTGVQQAGQAGNTTPQATVSPASEGQNGTPTKPIVYTKEDLDREVQKARTNAGRIEAEYNRKLKEIADQETRINEWQKQRDAEELEKAKNNPEQLSVYQKKQELNLKEKAIADREKAIADRETQFNERLTKAEKLEREFTISIIAKEFQGGDVQKLTKAAESLGLTDETKIRVLAQTLWPQVAGQPGKVNLAASQVFNGSTNGGSGVDISKMSPMEKIKWGQEHSNK